ncbi:MAG: hypothetical protein MK132_15975 [Lentisphaerales bacterium]|nr:hypothetical protein [Lentisphaerales bacterium]
MKNIFYVLALFGLFTCYADDREALKRIPAHYDYVLAVRFPEMLKNEKVSQKIFEDKEFLDFQKEMKSKIGLESKDIISLYIGGVAAQYQRMKSWRELSKQQYDTAVFVELAKPLDLAVVKQKFPGAFAAEKTVNGVTCVQFKDEKIKNAYLAFLKPNLLMLTADHQLPELTKLPIENSVLADERARRLLTTNGFGGVCSFVHWGKIGEVHPMTPWMKDYNGGSFNLYFEDNQDISAECTMTFNKLESVKGASLLVNMGLSFLDFKPEFAQLKRLIDFKVYEKNLLIDVKLTEKSWNMITKAFDEMKMKRRPRK